MPSPTSTILGCPSCSSTNYRYFQWVLAEYEVSITDEGPRFGDLLETVDAQDGGYFVCADCDCEFDADETVSL